MLSLSDFLYSHDEELKWFELRVKLYYEWVIRRLAILRLFWGFGILMQTSLSVLFYSWMTQNSSIFCRPKFWVWVRLKLNWVSQFMVRTLYFGFWFISTFANLIYSHKLTWVFLISVINSKPLFFVFFSFVWRLRCSQREETADDSKLESVCPHNRKIMIGFFMVHGKAILFDLFPMNNWAFHFSLNHFLALKLDVWIKVGGIVS